MSCHCTELKGYYRYNMITERGQSGLQIERSRVRQSEDPSCVLAGQPHPVAPVGGDIGRRD